MERTALITGGTDGIGKATARRLLQGGWRVVVTGRDPERCRATVEELQAVGGPRVEGLLGDLTRMPEVARLADGFRSMGTGLDLLLLNANAISQERRLTPEGFEANFAIGYLGRALLTWSLEPLLQATPGAQVLSVVGLNLERVDFEDLSMERGYSDMKALGRWQWAIQVFSRELNRRGPVAMNTFMPGLVKTKILANEPQPMRTIVRVANWVMGLTPDQSAAEVEGAVEQVARDRLRDAYFNRARPKPPRTLGERPEDGSRLWEETARLLGPYLPAGRDGG